MNRLAFTLLMVLFAATTWGQQGLGSAGGGTYYGPAPYAGTHKPGELIIHFSNPKTTVSAQNNIKAKLDKEGASLVTFSRYGGYALVRLSGYRTGSSFEACRLIGDGNNLLTAIGEGDGSDLNYIMGTDYIDNGSQSGVNYSNYELNGNCSGDYPVIPETAGGNALVRIGVIDGGMYARYGRTSINGVTVNQTVFSGADPSITNRSLTSSDYSSHGRAILALISGTFRSLNLHGQLSLESYRVMDRNLRATVFDVASAIEYAAVDGRRRPQILTISIGFKPAGCSAYSRGIVAENSILREAIKTAQNYGIIVFTSAGNDGRSLDVYPQYPAVEDDVFTNVVTVGSMACYGDNLSQWSNFSSNSVDLLTVGENVNIIDNGRVNKMSGTSFSCPVVATKAGLHVASMSSPSYPFRPTNVLCALYQQTVPNPGSIYGIVDASAYRSSYCPTTPGPGTGNGPIIIEPYEPTPGGSLGWMTISPNPVNDMAKLQFSGDVLDATLSIMDSGGNIIKEERVSSNVIDLNLTGFKTGMYWVALRSSEGITTKRVVKR